jgi:hypothetical protein
MSKSNIQDSRTTKDLKGITFSGYKILAVVKKMIISMLDEKIEEACYWCAELVCSGHYSEIWEAIIQYYCKYIHIANPKLSLYIWCKLKKFKENMNDLDTTEEELELRNNPGFRQMFIEIVVTLTISTKKYTVNEVKVQPQDFNMINLSSILQATDLSFSEDIFKEDDPKELMVTINEMAYNIHSSVANTRKSCYWFEWINEYTKTCKKNKTPCKIHKRENDYINETYCTNPVWLVWDVILKESKTKSTIIGKIIDSLFGMFCLRYSDTVNTKRRFVVYFAISLLTTDILLDKKEIISDKDKNVVSCVVSQIDKIFIQVKEKGTVKQELEDDNNELPVENKIISTKQPTSREKMQILSDFENGFIPRL